MGLSDFIGAAIILAVAVACSLLVLMAEYVYVRWIRPMIRKHLCNKVAAGEIPEITITECSIVNLNSPTEHKRSSMLVNILPDPIAKDFRYSGRRRATCAHNASMICLKASQDISEQSRQSLGYWLIVLQWSSDMFSTIYDCFRIRFRSSHPLSWSPFTHLVPLINHKLSNCTCIWKLTFGTSNYSAKRKVYWLEDGITLVFLSHECMFFSWIKTTRLTLALYIMILQYIAVHIITKSPENCKL